MLVLRYILSAFSKLIFMKNRLLLAIISLSLLTPVLAFSAPNMAAKLKGKILLAVEDKGKTYYVHTDGNRYQITKDTAQKVFEKLSVGVSNNDLKQIPLKDAGVESVATDSSKVVYVNNPAQCNYDSYNQEILRLKSEVASLKANAAVGVAAPSTPTVTKESLNKEYGLKINDLQKKKIEMNEIKMLGNAQHMKFRSSRNYDDISADTPNKQEIGSEMLSFTKYTSLSNYYGPYFSEKETSINNQILSLQNELERKLLELN